MSHLIPRAPNAQAIHAFGEDLAAIAREKRRRRSLQTCHRPAIKPEPTPYRRPSQAYVPQFSARLLNDPGLTDGARRCAIKLLELAYRRNRTERAYQGTVSYLAKALGRSERAVQAYLALLRSRGYIRHEIVTSERARMCIGIIVTLLTPLFPKHHESGWPHHAKPIGSGVNRFSENYRPDLEKRRGAMRLSVEHWSMRCMDGVFRALMKSTVAPQGSLA
ncbi:MAG: hypothetical protein ABMA15_04430 [Vicinamibacterales bacterium]